MQISGVLATVLITVGGGVQPADGQGVTIGQNCYSLSPACTMVYSRHTTKHTIAPAASGVGNGLLATLIGVCTAGAGKNGGATCAAIFGSYNGASQAAIAQAAANNQCVSYTTYFSESIPGVWRTNNGPDCRDR